MCARARIQAPTHQLLCLLQRALRLADGRFPRLAGRLPDVLQLLVEVGLHQLQLRLVAAKALGARLCVDEVRHGVLGVRVLLFVCGEALREICSAGMRFGCACACRECVLGVQRSTVAQPSANRQGPITCLRHSRVDSHAVHVHYRFQLLYGLKFRRLLNIRHLWRSYQNVLLSAYMCSRHHHHDIYTTFVYPVDEFDTPSRCAHTILHVAMLR